MTLIKNDAIMQGTKESASVPNHPVIKSQVAKRVFECLRYWDSGIAFGVFAFGIVLLMFNFLPVPNPNNCDEIEFQTWYNNLHKTPSLHRITQNNQTTPNLHRISILQVNHAESTVKPVPFIEDLMRSTYGEDFGHTWSFETKRGCMIAAISIMCFSTCFNVFLLGLFCCNYHRVPCIGKWDEV